jgi:hypothetical protein
LQLRNRGRTQKTAQGKKTTAGVAKSFRKPAKMVAKGTTIAAQGAETALALETEAEAVEDNWQEF